VGEVVGEVAHVSTSALRGAEEAQSTHSDATAHSGTVELFGVFGSPMLRRKLLQVKHVLLFKAQFGALPASEVGDGSHVILRSRT
jgi:hypothetical protein